jgi:phage terminase Nu1 subunit (DNA packaging protein)
VTLMVNKAELARIFGVSEPTVSKWLADALPFVKGGSNGVPYEFDVDQVKTWRADREAAERDAAHKREEEISRRQAELFGEQRFVPDGLSQSEIGEYLENLRLFEIVKRQRGESIDRDLVRREFQAVFNVLRQHVLGWATTLAKTATLTAEQQRAAEQIARRTLDAAWRQISDPDLRPGLDDGGA